MATGKVKSSTTRKVKKKTQRQARFLLSEGSPLTGKQKKKLVGELRSGTVKLLKGRGIRKLRKKK